MLLNKGSFEGKQIISPAAINEMLSTQIPVPPEFNPYNAPAPCTTYGLGWFLYDYCGCKLVAHGGSVNGMQSLVGFIPAKKFGVVILTNHDPQQGPVTTALMYKLFDIYLGRPNKDWNKEFFAIFHQQEQKALDKQKAEYKVLASTHEAVLPLTSYVGQYTNEEYGTTRVWLDHDKLYFQLNPEFIGPLKNLAGNNFVVQWSEKLPGNDILKFSADSNKCINSLSFSDVATFTRVNNTN